MTHAPPGASLVLFGWYFNGVLFEFCCHCVVHMWPFVVFMFLPLVVFVLFDVLCFVLLVSLPLPLSLPLSHSQPGSTVCIEPGCIFAVGR